MNDSIVSQAYLDRFIEIISNLNPDFQVLTENVSLPFAFCLGFVFLLLLFYDRGSFCRYLDIVCFGLRIIRLTQRSIL